MLSLQQELDALREERAREKDIAERRARQDQEDIQALRERCEFLESEGGAGSVSDRFIFASICSLTLSVGRLDSP